MRAKLFKLLWVFSLLVCLFALTNFVAGLFGLLPLEFSTRSDARASVTTSPGNLTFCWRRSMPPPVDWNRPDPIIHERPGWPTMHRLIPGAVAYQFSTVYSHSSGRNETANEILALDVNYGLVALVGALAPLLALSMHLRRRNRIVSGCCVKCGYDLRATPDRCPECGTVAAANQ